MRCSTVSSAQTTSTIKVGFSHDVGLVLGPLHSEFGAAVPSGSATAPPTARIRKGASTARSRQNRELFFAMKILEEVPKLLSEAEADCPSGSDFMS